MEAARLKKMTKVVSIDCLFLGTRKRKVVPARQAKDQVPQKIIKMVSSNMVGRGGSESIGYAVTNVVEILQRFHGRICRFLSTPELLKNFSIVPGRQKIVDNRKSIFKRMCQSEQFEYSF